MVSSLLLDPDVLTVFGTVIGFLVAILAYKKLGYKFGWRAGLGTSMALAGIRAIIISGFPKSASPENIANLSMFIVGTALIVIKPPKQTTKT